MTISGVIGVLVLMGVIAKIVYEINKLYLKTGYHSQNPQNFDDLDVSIVDTFADTKKFHKIGSSVFLGGSLI